MLKIKSIALIAAAVTLGATASIAGTRDIHKYGKFFQNVKAEHVKPLLSGSAFVAHSDFEGLGKNSASGGELAIVWYGANGVASVCVGAPSEDVPYGSKQASYRGVVFHSKFLKAQFPLVQYYRGDRDTVRDLIRYNPLNGTLGYYRYQKPFYWEMDTGHLQTELPAVTWDLCPDFPSAKSLGAQVNKKQTAKFYLDLVRQDPGKRVRKPEFESKEPTVVWLDRFGKELKPRK